MKSKSRILYKTRAVSIIARAIDSHGDIEELIISKFKQPNLGKCTKRFKTKYFSKSLINDVLMRRDRWIQCTYFTLHKLNMYCTELSAKFNLATDDGKSEALLGPACHAKGWTPYFPEFCFTNGIEEYPFSHKKKKNKDSSRPGTEGTVINPCVEDCLSACDDQTNIVLDIVEH